MPDEPVEPGLLLSDVSRKVHLHFLDRELLTSLGLYEALHESRLEEDLLFVLASTYEPAYLSMSLAFENRFARKSPSRLLPLFRAGHIQVAMKESSLRDFQLARTQQYSHARELCPLYFDETWKGIADLDLAYLRRELDTTEAIKSTIIPDLQHRGVTVSAKRLGVEVSGGEVDALTPHAVDAIAERKGRAITKLLFAQPYERLTATTNARRSFDIKISVHYVGAYPLTHYSFLII